MAENIRLVNALNTQQSICGEQFLISTDLTATTVMTNEKSNTNNNNNNNNDRLTAFDPGQPG